MRGAYRVVAWLSCASCRNATRTPRPRRSSTRRSSGRRAGEYGDIRYEKADGIAKITIDRPEVRNAFRPQTLVEISRRARAGPRGPRGRRDHPHRRRAERRSARAATRRSAATTATSPTGASRRPPRRHRPAGADPAAAEAGGGDGRRLRGRRRPHPPPLLRPDDRRRQRPLRADRAAGRQLRRRLRRLPAARPRRDQEGEGDLAPVPPVRRRGGARDGPGQRGRPARRARARDGRLVPRDARASPPSPCACSRRASTPHEDGYAGIQQLAHDANLLFYVSEEAREGREAFKERRAARLLEVPAARP